MGAPFHSVESLLAAVEASLAEVDAHTARAAVFDADHTLWEGDIGDEAFAAAGAEGFLLAETWQGPVRAWGQAWGLSLSPDPADGVRQVLEAAGSGQLEATALARGLPTGGWRADLYAMQAWAFGGRTRREVAAFGEQLFSRGFERRVYGQMRQLVAGLARLGVEVWIASASHGALVVPGGARLGLAESRVLGMEPALDGEGRTLHTLAGDTYGPAKASAVRQVLGGRRPLWAFGDSVLNTDRELLAAAAHGVAVAAKAAHREAAVSSPTLRLFDPA
ncbi:MAG: haloacid dehalogenase-like hydrolase [Deltaproteobacteria bacterium]|nr:haloacid dehalogenase-like hydrolase [Deltaproteobacteria bacterium]